MKLRPDRTGRYLAVLKSALILWAPSGQPVVRLEFEDGSHKAPTCHWQFHGEHAGLQALLASTGKTKASAHLFKLHFPVGGRRMRPSVEDFLQFLIQECGFQGRPGWDKAVDKSRLSWRLRQTRTIARDAPREAAKAVTEHLGMRSRRQLAKEQDELPSNFSAW